MCILYWIGLCTQCSILLCFSLGVVDFIRLVVYSICLLSITIVARWVLPCGCYVGSGCILQQYDVGSNCIPQWYYVGYDSLCLFCVRCYPFVGLVHSIMFLFLYFLHLLDSSRACWAHGSCHEVLEGIWCGLSVEQLVLGKTRIFGVGIGTIEFVQGMFGKKISLVTS